MPGRAIGTPVSCPRCTQGSSFVQGRTGAVSVQPARVRSANAARVAGAINEINRRSLDVVGDPEIATRISSYEMAFRMQPQLPEATALSQEPQHILEMYGAEPGKSSFANNCLLARR